MRLFLVALLAAAFCHAGGELLVITGIAAQNEAVSEIGKGLVIVRNLLPVGASPETYSPSARQLAICSQAVAFISMGTPMERALLPKLKASFPRLKVWDGTQGMAYRKDEDGHAAAHSKGGMDPHLWLSIANMKIHADTVARALCDALPAETARINANLADYLKRLDELQGQVSQILAPLKGRTVIVFHPAFGYLLDSVGLRQLAVEQHGRDASARHLAELKDKAAKLECRLVFVQPQSNPISAAKAAEILQRKTRVLSPIPENYSPGMLEMARTLRSAFE